VDGGRTKIQDGKFYAIGDGEEVFVKKLEKRKGEKVRVISVNKKHGSKTVPGKNLRIIGQVLWVGRELA